MNIEILKRFGLRENKYCDQLTLFTTGHSIKEIYMLKNSGTKIVCFGAGINSYKFYHALIEADIGPDIVTDNTFKTLGTCFDGTAAATPESLLKENKKYYFIVTVSTLGSANHISRQLLLWGVENFAIIDDSTVVNLDLLDKDLGNAFLTSINKIAAPLDFTQNNYNNIRHLYTTPLKWWYKGAEWIIKHYRDQKNLKLLDVGPGAGLASYIYKAMIGASVDWIKLKEYDLHYSDWYNQSLIESENVNVHYGYIEIDDFTNLGEYDIILFTEVLEHLLFNPVSTLKKLYNMLKPGGRLVLTTPRKGYTKGLCYYSSWRELPNPGGDIARGSKQALRISGSEHIYEYTIEEVEEVLIEAGFKVVYQDVQGKAIFIYERPTD